MTCLTIHTPEAGCNTARERPAEGARAGGVRSAQGGPGAAQPGDGPTCCVIHPTASAISRMPA